MDAELKRGSQATALLVGLLIFGATLAACGGDDGDSGDRSQGPCGLLTTGEVAPLLPTRAEPTPVAPKTVNGVTVMGCYWSEADGPDTPEAIERLGVDNLALTVETASEDYVNKEYERLTAGGGVPIDGLGDKAAVGSRRLGQSDIIVIVERTLLSLNLRAEGAEGQQDELVELAEAAVERM